MAMQASTRRALLLAPATAWFAAMLVLPLIFVFVFSFGERGPAGGYVPAFTLALKEPRPGFVTGLWLHLIQKVRCDGGNWANKFSVDRASDAAISASSFLK